jgi:hypothetical protein
MRKGPVVLVVLLVLLLLKVLLVLVLVQDLWETGPLEETSSREDALEGTAHRKCLSRVAVTRTMVLCRNDQSRRSWRTTGGTVETGVESGCRES